MREGRHGYILFLGYFVVSLDMVFGVVCHGAANSAFISVQRGGGDGLLWLLLGSGLSEVRLSSVKGQAHGHEKKLIVLFAVFSRQDRFETRYGSKEALVLDM